MTTSQPNRPWYCRDAVVDEYRATLSEAGDSLPMLKSLKILRAIVVNAGIITIGLYAIYRGGNPTLLGTMVLLVLGAYNGLELGDYLALLQAYQEVQADDPPQTEDRNK